jgi:uncharacterized protein
MPATPSHAAHLYDTTVPVLSRFLKQLQGLLDVAQRQLAAQGLDEASLLHARLVPDMMPLHQQAVVAVNFAFRTCAPLVQRTIDTAAPVDVSLAALRARIAQAQAFLDELRTDEFDGAAQRMAHDRAGLADIALDGETYATQYALPNFFFHLSMVYAILRQNGIAIGKPDFDGWHAYPPIRG